jgi:hypothetical protein
MGKSEIWMSGPMKNYVKFLATEFREKYEIPKLERQRREPSASRRASNASKLQSCKTNKTFTTHNTRYCESIPYETCIKRKWWAVPASTQTRIRPGYVTFGCTPTVVAPLFVNPLQVKLNPKYLTLFILCFVTIINPLKTKCMFYIRTRCVPRCKHSPLRL